MNTLVNTPLVSIIIPVYNRERYIEIALNSAVNQTYKNIEIIVVDNCSTDHTWTILQKYAAADSRIKIFQNSRNLGPVLNWNECFKRANGEYIKIVWSDDWMSDDFIEKALPVLKRDVAFVISSIQITTGQKVISTIEYSKSLFSTKEYLQDVFLFNRNKFPLSPGCALFRTADLLSAFIIDIPNENGLDSKCNGAGNDLLLFLNTAVSYPNIGVLTAVHSYFRHHEGSFSVSNNLDLYYDWAKVYFLKRNKSYSFLSDALKFRFFKRQLKDKSYRAIFGSLRFSNCFIAHCLKCILLKYKH